MPRKILALSERFIFTAHYDVLHTDVNRARHLGDGAAFRARVQA